MAEPTGKVNISTAEAIANIKNLNAQIKKLQKTISARSKRVGAIENVNQALKNQTAVTNKATVAGKKLTAQTNKDILKNKQRISGLKTQNTLAQKRIKLLREQKKAGAGATGSLDGLSKPSLRYALYDVGSSLTRIATASAALAAVPVGFAIKYEREFANVARTTEITGDKLEQLRKDLINISQATPVSWEDITNISTLAGQLGIAENLIAGFTETVAKFSATTDLTVDAAATGFGRLNQLIDGVDGQFDKLASSILAVGVSSVATESQIVNVATNIASMGNLAGLSAQDVVGLSGAMASLGIRPELARGNITRLFSNINKAVAESGFALKEYGRLTGVAAEDFGAAWSSEPTKVLLDLFEGIQKEGSNAERTLRDLGITSVRDIPAFLRLAQSQDEVRRLVDLSNREFIKGQKVNEQYGIIAGTTGEQLKRLTQNFATLGATIGQTALGPISLFIGSLNEMVTGLTDVVATPFGQAMSFIAIALALVIASLTGMVAILALTLAGLSATKFAADSLGVSFAGVTIKSLFTGKAFEIMGIKAIIASSGLSKLFAVIKFGTLALGAIGIVLGVVGLAFSAYSKEAERSKKVQNDLFGSTEALNNALAKDKEEFEETGKKIKSFTVNVRDGAKYVRDATDDAIDFAAGQGEVTEKTKRATEALEEQGQRLIVLGSNFSDFIKTQAAQSQELLSAFESQALREGFRQEFGQQDAFGSFIDLAIGNPDEARKRLGEIRKEIQSELAASQGSSALGYAAQDPAQIEALKATLGPIEDLISSIEDGTFAVDNFDTSLGFLEEPLEGVADRADIAAGKVDRLLDSIFGEANAAEKAKDATQDFFAELADGGDAADITSKSLQEMIDSISGNSFRRPSERIADLNVILEQLEDQGLGASKSADAVRQAMLGLALAAGIVDESFTKLPDHLASSNLQMQEIINTISPLLGLLDAATDGTKGLGDTTEVTSGKIETLSEKFDKLVSSIFEPVNAAQSAAKSIADLGESYAELGDDAFYASSEIQDAVSNILKSSASPAEGVANLNALYSQLASTVGSETAPSLAFLRNTIDQVASSFGVAGDAVEGATVDLDFFNMTAQEAQQEIRTLSDYAGDLEGVISRAFDIRYASTFEIDKIAQAWFDLGNQVEDARKEIEDLVVTQEGLSADRSLKEYFLSIADAYGDTLRAGILREELSALEKEQQDNAKAIAEAQAIAGGDLTGQGPGQRQNRSALLGLVGDYQGYITTLAESGASQDELRKATERARKEFIAQALELGYQEDVVLQYAQAFDDVKTAIDRVPRNITVDANTNPAIQALNELNAKLKESINLAGRLNQIQGQPVPPAEDFETKLYQRELIKQ